MANNPLPLALLIDAENVSCKTIDRIMHEVDKLGEPIIRRIYGDFTKQHMACWHNIIERHAFTVSPIFAYKKGKNCSDIELIMDAITFQYTTPIMGLIIVSGDSDFCGLAKRYREQNRPVYVIGTTKTAEALMACSTQFILIEERAQEVPKEPVKTTANQEPSIYKVPRPILAGLQIKGKMDCTSNAFVQKANSVLKMCAGSNNLVRKIEFIQAFQRQYPGVSIKEAGYKTWHHFFESNKSNITLEQINNDYFIKLLQKHNQN